MSGDNAGTPSCMAGIELASTAFNDQDLIPRRHTKDGEDLSPPLTWSGIPDGTAELVLLCEDPDAPSGTFLHWVVTGIDPDSRGVEEGHTPPAGSPGTNGFGSTGWGGPRPPAGDKPHRYAFRLYALSEPVALSDGADADTVHRAVDHRKLAVGTLVGRYGR